MTDEFSEDDMLKDLKGLEEIGKMKPPKISNIKHFLDKPFAAGINAKGNAQYKQQCILCAACYNCHQFHNIVTSSGVHTSGTVLVIS